MKTTVYSLLLLACGLSISEAAGLHRVTPSTCDGWAKGRVTTPDRCIVDLRALFASLAARSYGTIKNAEAFSPTNTTIHIQEPMNNREALGMGFPCLGAWRAYASMVASETDYPVTLVRPATTNIPKT